MLLLLLFLCFSFSKKYDLCFIFFFLPNPFVYYVVLPRLVCIIYIYICTYLVVYIDLFICILNSDLWTKKKKKPFKIGRSGKLWLVCIIKICETNAIKDDNESIMTMQHNIIAVVYLQYCKSIWKKFFKST